MKEYVLTQNAKNSKLKLAFLKKDLVFTISLILAMASSLIHPPRLEYINFKVLVSLFNLMLAIKAFEELKLLDRFAIGIVNKCKSSKQVSAILILLCFFTSMLVTNDVALITFVPLTLIISKKAKINMMETIVLQTIAANIGSSLTPMGNPQNLFIFSHYGISPAQFFTTILLLAFLGGSSLYISIYRLKGKKLNIALDPIPIKSRKKAAVWGIIFCIIIVSIFGGMSYQLAAIITFLAACILDYKLLAKIDYLLLITFICFFIFIGNIANIEALRDFASECLKNSTSVYFSSILASQLISNVPASILLSNFTMDWKSLLLGVNIGGLGTIIASLASVISYKLYIQSNPGKSKRYLIQFSLYNFLFLIFLSLIQFFILRLL
ncbi:anion transporter [Bacillus salipaludis]|uniref:Anion transporter n=1 Tax=Bacillus salipaludis TaxID=2547811 RepID=A0A4R5VQG2_9BACI|nr:SLC13 family permease [Bacillus salipaludis]MDQ6598637.1 SLC13 family permease [Bacillus salipaludis]TDK60817.1 anion transporter [Bacillus salipaludis]